MSCLVLLLHFAAPTAVDPGVLCNVLRRRQVRRDIAALVQCASVSSCEWHQSMLGVSFDVVAQQLQLCLAQVSRLP